MSISGKSGSGKTNVMIDIVRKIMVWDKIYLCVKDSDEPLYKWFADKVREVEKHTGASIITVISDPAKIPYVQDMNRKVNNLLIFDDLVCEKDKMLKRVEEYYIRGRKMNCSCAFLSQSYYGIPRMIRKNCYYIILKHIGQESDLKRILSDYAELEVSFETLSKLYHKAIDSGTFNFFMIDLYTKNPDLKFRINYEGVPASEWSERDTSQPSDSQ